MSQQLCYVAGSDRAELYPDIPVMPLFIFQIHCGHYLIILYHLQSLDGTMIYTHSHQAWP